MVSLARGRDRHCMHASLSCGSDVDVLNGAAKGDGESDDNADTMWVEVSSCLVWEKRVIN